MSGFSPSERMQREGALLARRRGPPASKTFPSERGPPKDCYTDEGASSEAASDLSEEAFPSDTDSDAAFRPQNEFERRLVAEAPPLQEERMPLYSLMLAVALTAVGTAFALSGWEALKAEGLYSASSFLLMAFLCLCPGVFHLGIFLMVWIKVPGFSYDMLK